MKIGTPARASSTSRRCTAAPSGWRSRSWRSSPASSIVSELMEGRRGISAPFVPPFSWAMTAARDRPDAGVLPRPHHRHAGDERILLAHGAAERDRRPVEGAVLRRQVADGDRWSRSRSPSCRLRSRPGRRSTAASMARRPRRRPTAPPPRGDSRTARARRSGACRRSIDSTRQALAAAQRPRDSARDPGRRRRADSTQAALRQALRDVRSQRPRAVYPAPDPNAPLVSLGELKVAGGYALGSLGFAAMAFMLAMLLRSTGGAIGVFFLYFAFLEQLIWLMMRRFGSVELANAVTPYMPLSALRGPIEPHRLAPGVRRASERDRGVGWPTGAGGGCRPGEADRAAAGLDRGLCGRDVRGVPEAGPVRT